MLLGENTHVGKGGVCAALAGSFGHGASFRLLRCGGMGLFPSDHALSWHSHGPTVEDSIDAWQPHEFGGGGGG